MDERTVAAGVRSMVRSARKLGKRVVLPKTRRWELPHSGTREQSRRREQMRRGTLRSSNRGCIEVKGGAGEY
jgi:hypothetical protein